MTYNDVQVRRQEQPIVRGRSPALRDRFVRLFEGGSIDAERMRLYAFQGPLPDPREFNQLPTWKQEDFWRKRVRDNLGPHTNTSNRDVRWQNFMKDLYASITFHSNKVDWAKEGF